MWVASREAEAQKKLEKETKLRYVAPYHARSNALAKERDKRKRKTADDASPRRPRPLPLWKRLLSIWAMSSIFVNCVCANKPSEFNACQGQQGDQRQLWQSQRQQHEATGGSSGGEKSDGSQGGHQEVSSGSTTRPSATSFGSMTAQLLESAIDDGSPLRSSGQLGEVSEAASGCDAAESSGALSSSIVPSSLQWSSSGEDTDIPLFNGTATSASEGTCAAEVEVAEAAAATRTIVTVVVSHCNTSLHTVSRILRIVNIHVSSVYIYSRCGIVPDYTGPGAVTRIEDDNRGSCDRVYWRHLVSSYAAATSGPTIFIKDTAYTSAIHQPGGVWRDMRTLIEEAKRNNFACGMYFEWANASIVWHDRVDLYRFEIDNYKGNRIRSHFSNIGDWWQRHSEVFLPWRGEHVPVCYGGVFAIRQLPHSTTAHRQILHDLSNQEVNHFMERSWARLFLQRNLRDECPRGLTPEKKLIWFFRGARGCLK